MRMQSKPSAELHKWSSSWQAQPLQLSSCLCILLRGAGQESVLPEGCSLPNDPGSQTPTPCPGGVNESRVCPAFFQLISLFRGALCLSGWHSDVQELSTTCEDVTSLTAACNYWMSCGAGDRYSSTGIQGLLDSWASWGYLSSKMILGVTKASKHSQLA